VLCTTPPFAEGDRCFGVVLWACWTEHINEQGPEGPRPGGERGSGKVCGASRAPCGCT
jgi:hypothetical protein